MKKGQVTATLVRKEYLTPHYIRVYLTSNDLEQFKETTVGDNNKIAIPPEGINEIHFPEFDSENHQWVYPPAEIAPSIRTYTHRGLDIERKELIIDFVNHGENGPASKWAINAKEGTNLGIMMRTTSIELFPQTDWYLLAGDATAIPVLSSILETLPKTSKGICIIEVPGKEDQQKLATEADIEFVWLLNPNPEKGSKIASKIKEIQLPEKSKFGYVAAEFSTVKKVRTYLRKEKFWSSTELNAYSYWKAGATEDKSQADRQKEKYSQQ